MGKSKLLNTNTLNDAPSNYMALDSMTHDLRLWVDLLNRPNRPDTSIHCLRESQPILAETLINHQEASDLFLRRRLPVRLGALLNEEYWTHMENMSVKSENRLASPRIETQAALASNMLDGMTSEGSTCPFTFEEYKTCLLALNKLARLDHSILPNWFIAHIIGLLVRNYDAKLYGQDYAKFNQIITIDTGWQLPRFNRIATAGDIHRSVHTIPHPYYNTSHGGARRKVTQSIDGEMLDGCQPYRSSTTASKLLTKIESSMDVSEVMRHLVEHGCQDLTDDLEVGSSSGHPVARGGLGNIYHVELQDGTKVAVKCLSNLRHIDASDKTSKILKRAAREVYAWSKCDHPGILPLRGIALFRGQIAMVSEWMPNGTLNSHLRKRLPFDRIQLCVRAAEALEYMHARGIVHGDIKTTNVLMSDDGNPLLTDFGNALVTHEPTLAFTTTTSLYITARYTPPEILTGDTRYSYEADVYTFGMMIFEVMTRQIPFPDTPSIAIVYAITVKRMVPERPDFSSTIRNKALEDELWSLLTHCWAYEPNKRPSASELRKRLRSIWQRVNNSSTN